MARLSAMLPSGQQPKTSSESVVLASDHPVVSVSSTDMGTVVDAPAVAPSQSGSMLSVLRGIWVEIASFNERLTKLTRALLSPVWFDPSTGALRFQAISGTITTVSTVSAVTTVSTVTNQSQVGGVDAKTAFADEIMMDAWSSLVRDRIT